MSDRPSNLLYGLNDRPPTPTLIGISAQHALVSMMLLVYPVVLAGKIGLDVAATKQFVLMSLFGVALATILQATRFGCGFLAVAIPNPLLIPAFAGAVRQSGFGSAIGTMIGCSLVQIGIARALPRLRAYFPSEVCGVPVIVLGLSLTYDALARLVGYGSVEQPFDGQAMIVGLATFLPIVALTIWGSRQMRIYALLIGCACGYGLALWFGMIGPEAQAEIAAIPFLAAPGLALPDLRFDLGIFLPMLIAMLVGLMDAVGCVIALDKISDPNWKRTDMRVVGRGIQTDGVASIAAGLLGGMNTAISSANIGLQVASAAAARIIGIVTGILMAAMAFVPKFIAVLVFMPGPVKGAIMLFAAGCLITAGIELVTARMLNERRSILVGLSVILGLSVRVLPGLYHGLPEWAASAFESEVTVAALAALFLNGLFRIGLSRRAELAFRAGATALDEIWEFFDRWGGNWGARREIVERARHVTIEALEALAGSNLAGGPIKIKLDYDEFNLDVTLRYVGLPLPLDAAPVDPETLIDADIDEIDRRLGLVAVALIRRQTDRLEQGVKGDTVKLALHFDH